MTQQRQALGESTQRAEEREFGPGWKDVHFMLREVRESSPVEPKWRITPMNSPEGRWGLRVTVYAAHDHVMMQGVGCYGTIFPGNGQKTVAAAMWHALHSWLHNPMPLGRPDDIFLHGASEEEEDLPF